MDIATIFGVNPYGQTYLGRAMAAGDTVFGGVTAPTGATIVFDETWMGCTAGTYTSGSPTGADETWDRASCTAGGVICPNPATGLVTLSGNGDDWYLKKSDIGIRAGTYEYLYFEFQAPATNGSYLYFYLYNANADQRVFQMNVNDEDDIYVNGAGPYDSTAGPDTTIPVKVIVNHSAKTFDMNINGVVNLTDVAWGDSTGTDGDMKRLDMYIGNNANNLKKLGRVYVANGWDE